MQEAAGSLSQTQNESQENIEDKVETINESNADNSAENTLNSELENNQSEINESESGKQSASEEISDNNDDEDEIEDDDDSDEESKESAEKARLERLAELREDLTDGNKAAFVEAVLFLESEPQPPENLAKITQLSLEDVNASIEILIDKYAGEDSGLELTQIIGGWVLVPKKDYFMFVRERYGKKNEGRLSKAAIETLTIIAYSQPITRAEIQNLRHVNVDNMMRILLDRKFIKEVGKKDVPGKPILYGTTKEFLEFFHLQSIADLPRLEEKESEVFELAR